MFLAIGCSSIATRGGGGGGGGGGGVHRWSDGEGVGNSGVRGGGNSAVGGVEVIGGGGVSSTSKNRPSQHKYKSPKQFELTELKGSKST